MDEPMDKEVALRILMEYTFQLFSDQITGQLISQSGSAEEYETPEWRGRKAFWTNAPHIGKQYHNTEADIEAAVQALLG